MARVMVEATSPAIQRSPAVIMPPVTHVRRCHGCGVRVGPNQTWCSTSCFRAEDGDERDAGHYDDYDHEDW